MRTKAFAGPRVRQLREDRGWTLAQSAGRLGLSVSYLSQIETNQRPLSGPVTFALTQVFGVDAVSLSDHDERRLAADLREAFTISSAPPDVVPQSEIRQVAAVAPRFARAVLDLHRAYRQTDERLKLADAAVALDGGSGVSASLPYEDVRDFFHYRDNYIHDLDVAAEELAADLQLAATSSREFQLETRLATLGVTVRRLADTHLTRRFLPDDRVLELNALQAAETRAFQMAYHLAERRLQPIVDGVLAGSGLRSRAAVDVCRVGLLNYAAGALIMPYRPFRRAARDLRHDVERLALGFGVSLEQVCHRLSNLQRPDARGVPMYFLRMDPAGNITKRHSATRFHFARFGGTCPLWNVHEAFVAPDRFCVQVVAMPDGDRYLSIARSVIKPTYSFGAPARRYVLGFGCELQDAHAFVYSDAVDLRAAGQPVGVSCRICPRTDCAQRAFPPMDRMITVDPSARSIVPFSISDEDQI